MGKKKEERIAGKSKEDFEKGLKEIYDQMNFKDLMLLRTKGKKAKLSTVLQYGFFPYREISHPYSIYTF